MAFHCTKMLNVIVSMQAGCKSFGSSVWWDWLYASSVRKLVQEIFVSRICLELQHPPPGKAPAWIPWRRAVMFSLNEN